MNETATVCPGCGLAATRKHGRDRLGQQIHQCLGYRRRFTALTGTPFSGYRFPPDVIAVAVRWYLRYRLSYADVAELLAERGVAVDPSTVYDWVREFAPLYEEAARPFRRDVGSSWNVDETCLKVAGKLAYVYRAIDGRGQVVDHDGRFPEHKGEIPAAVVAHLATQVDVPTAAWLAYDWRGRASEYHRAQIRETLGFRSATVQDADDLARWLAAEIAPREGRPDPLQAAAYARCRALRIEPPAPARVERLARSAWQLYEAGVHATTRERLMPATRGALDALLAEADPAAPPAVTLHDLRTDPGRAGLDSILRELAKLRRLRELQLPADRFRDVAPRLVQQFRQRAAVEPSSALRAHPEPIRHTLLAALGHLRGREITDTLLDLLGQPLGRSGRRAPAPPAGVGPALPGRRR